VVACDAGDRLGWGGACVGRVENGLGSRGWYGGVGFGGWLEGLAGCEKSRVDEIAG